MDSLLALLPTYGVWLILITVALSCLALPLPSSMMVMIAGGFAAAGDFAFWHLVGFAHAGFVLGDQVAFWIARHGGGPLINWFERKSKAAPVIGKAKGLVDRRGLVAVFLSRTVLSPLGPYVGYISGAFGMAWMPFTVTAIIGAFIWSVGYTWIGFTFAGQIGQIASMISSSVGVIMAGAVAIFGLGWMIQSYRKSSAD